MKKIVLLALTLILLLTVAMPLSVAADESSDVTEPTAAPTTTRVLNPNKLNVCVGSATAKQGDTVEIPVTIETNPGVWGINVDVHYDEKVMVLQNIVFSEEFKKDMSCLEIDNLASDMDHNYSIPFGLNATANSLTSNVKTTGLFATCTFLVIPGCELGDTEISLTYKPANITDVDLNDVLSAMYNGTVTVTKGQDAVPGVTYFPSRTRKAITTTKTANGALGGSTLIVIIVGAVLVVGVVLAILVVRKPAPAEENAAPAKPAGGDAKPASEPKTEPATTEDDGIDDQA